MTLERAILILEVYNKWRKGELEDYPINSNELSEAIDTVLKQLKK